MTSCSSSKPSQRILASCFPHRRIQFCQAPRTRIHGQSHSRRRHLRIKVRPLIGRHQLCRRLVADGSKLCKIFYSPLLVRLIHTRRSLMQQKPACPSCQAEVCVTRRRPTTHAAQIGATQQRIPAETKQAGRPTWRPVARPSKRCTRRRITTAQSPQPPNGRQSAVHRLGGAHRQQDLRLCNRLEAIVRLVRGRQIDCSGHS